MIEQMVLRSGQYQSKLMKSVTSCGGHLARVDLSIHYNSVNAFQNQLKLCTLKVQDDVQLANSKIFVFNRTVGPRPLFMISQ